MDKLLKYFWLNIAMNSHPEKTSHDPCRGPSDDSVGLFQKRTWLGLLGLFDFLQSTRLEFVGCGNLSEN